MRWPDRPRRLRLSKRYPLIAKAVGALKVRSATFDGEAVVCGQDGVSDFEMLHSRGYGAILYAFDLLELDGEDLRPLPLHERKATLAKLLRRAPVGIHLTEHIQSDGPIIFEHACKLGLEGIVSGPCKAWLKIKNPTAPAMLRLEDGTW